MSELINNYYKSENNIYELPLITDDEIFNKIKNDFNDFDTTLKRLLSGYPVDNFSLIKHNYIENDEIISTRIKLWRYQYRLPDYITLTDELKEKINDLIYNYNGRMTFKIAHVGSNLWKNLRSSFFTNKNFTLIEIISVVPQDYIDEWIKINKKYLLKLSGKSKFIKHRDNDNDEKKNI